MWLDALIAYSLQLAILVSVGLLLPAALQVRQPAARLAWLQAVFAACLLAPLWQPWVADPVRPLVELRLYTTGVTTAQPSASWRWVDLIAVFLAAGVGLRWLGLALGLFRLRCCRGRAMRLLPIPAVVERLQSRLGARADFYLSDELASPLTFGFRRAVVLLPARFPEMPEKTQEAIVCHELCHVRRRDWLMTCLEAAVRGLLWFHPLVAWLIREIQLTREQVVDRQVVDITGSRRAYLDALVEIAVARVHPALAVAPLFLSKHHITRRVEKLTEEVSMSRVRLAVSLAFMFAVLGGAGRFSAWSFPLQATRPSPLEAKDVSEKAQAFAQAWERAERVYQLGDGDITEPKVIFKVGPEYTWEARNAKLEGTVVLSIKIRPDGRAHGIRVIRGLGMGLDQKAVEAVEKWIFEPALKDGVPVTVLAAIEIPFGEGWLRKPAERVYRVQDGVMAPRILYQPEPEYTQEARDAKFEGTVVLSVEIWPDGRVHNIRVMRGLGMGLDERAIEAVQEWLFQPGLKDGEPVTVAATIEVNFRLP